MFPPVAAKNNLAPCFPSLSFPQNWAPETAPAARRGQRWLLPLTPPPRWSGHLHRPAVAGQEDQTLDVQPPLLEGSNSPPLCLH